MTALLPSSTSLKIHVLASGSKGNATVIENTQNGRALAVDCGICKREFFARCEEVGVSLDSIEGFLITHGHTDHTKGLGVVTRGFAARGLNTHLYVGSKTAAVSREIEALRDTVEVNNFREDDSLTLAGIRVQAFATSHDTAESFGFRFEVEDDSIGYMTDTGVVTPGAFEALQECRILALESNHDVHMLETGPYPYVLKQRVASDKGHLSNAQAAEALARLLCTKLEQVIALHISENNNTYPLPQKTLDGLLAQHNHPANVRSAYQHRVMSC